MTKKLRFGKSIPANLHYFIAPHPEAMAPLWVMKKNETNEKRSYGARLCLLTLAEQFFPNDYSLPLLRQEQIEIKNHTELTLVKAKHAVSIAHTDDKAIATLAIDLESVGVDLEQSGRVIKVGIEKFFINDGDIKNLSSLELWCVKEACFKTLSPFHSLWKNESKQVLTLKDISIKEDGAYYNQKKFADLALYEDQGLLIAFSWF